MLAGVDAGKTKITELKTGDDIEMMTAAYDYSIISFFEPSNEKSVLIDSFMEGAQWNMNLKIKDGDWSDRKVGWFRVDMEAHPDMKYSESPDQLVMSKEGLKRQIHFDTVSEAETENTENLSEIVKELTGDWTMEIKCDEIQSNSRANYDEIVYFGKKEDLEKDGKAFAMTEIS